MKWTSSPIAYLFRIFWRGIDWLYVCVEGIKDQVLIVLIILLNGARRPFWIARTLKVSQGVKMCQHDQLIDSAEIQFQENEVKGCVDKRFDFQIIVYKQSSTLLPQGLWSVLVYFVIFYRVTCVIFP